MNFDNFDGIDIVDKISLLRNCKSAERNMVLCQDLVQVKMRNFFPF